MAGIYDEIKFQEFNGASPAYMTKEAEARIRRFQNRGRFALGE